MKPPLAQALACRHRVEIIDTGGPQGVVGAAQAAHSADWKSERFLFGSV
jgi:hypothetical protein